MADINIPGIISMVVFYALILIIGIWAARKKGKSRNVESETEDTILAGRDIGMFVGIFTMTATWVGGGYINGSAEIIYKKGLLWCQAPIGYAISLILGGVFFAKPMRSRGYITMLDPIQEVVGNKVGALLFIPAVMGEMLWCSSILAALGSTMSVILDLPFQISVIISSAIAVFYTLIGGLYAVAYTDVIQLGCIFCGLWLCIPFALTHSAVSSIDISVVDWVGSISVWQAGDYIDHYLLLIFGGIPWQAYFQRVLSSRTPKIAQVLSITAGIGCFILVIPALIIGAIAKATDWQQTSFGEVIGKDEENKVLPLVLQHLTPVAVSFFGLGAVSAAVMSSADSTVLSAASMFTRNVYKLAIRPSASDVEQMRVMKVAILCNGVISTCIALFAKSIYDLFIMCGDVVYVILFPQLLTVVHFPTYINSYGSIYAFFVGIILRCLTGEKSLGIPSIIKLPFYSEEEGQLFPYRTLVMVLCLITIFSVSAIASKVFSSGMLSKKYDVFHCFTEEPRQINNDQSQNNGREINNDQNQNQCNGEVKIQSANDKPSLEMTKF